MWYKPCDSVAWYVVPLISWCILAFSALWFLGFVSIAKYRSHIGRKKFTYMCEPEFDWAEKSQQNLAGDDDLPAGETPGTRRGGLILIHETIYKTWQAMETSDLHSHAADNMDGSIIPAQGGLHQEHRHGLSGAEELANTDFTAFGRNEASGDEMELRVSRDTQYATLRGQQNRSERV